MLAMSCWQNCTGVSWQAAGQSGPHAVLRFEFGAPADFGMGDETGELQSAGSTDGWMMDENDC